MKKLIQKQKDHDIGTVILRCECKCCMLAIDKYRWAFDNSTEYNISMQESYLNNTQNTLVGRLKRALKIIFGKPISYNSLYIEDEEKLIEFRDALNRLICKNE